MILVSYVDGCERARREVPSEHAARRVARRVQSQCTPYNVFPRFALEDADGRVVMTSVTTGGRIRWKRSVPEGREEQGAAVAEGPRLVGIPDEYLADVPHLVGE